ncbi:MAG: ATP-dependent zinc metalloprotease FtsH [Fimbriimonadaceae bacterium]|nr:ATP-dependent zinc metalloprotease FtsH [Fimbriimonadaceae bacterium]
MVLVVIGAMVLLQTMATGGGPLSLAPSAPEDLSLSDFTQKVNEDTIKEVNWQQQIISGDYGVDGKKTKFTVYAVSSDSPAGADLIQLFDKKGVKYKINGAPPTAALIQLAGLILPVILIGGFIYFMMVRQAQASGNQAINFGRSRAKRAGENTPKVTFEDVAGIEEAKEELYEVVDFLRNTKKYVALGAKIPKGILLTGPPGVGKTHLARAIAGEAGVPFFHISGSDFVEMFVGVGAARVRDLFDTAKAHRPCLIFVDEIDAVGRQRGAGLGGGHDEREQTLNQLLVEMDGFDPNTGVILIAATNRPDVLDPALLRPGRFDRQIVVDAPDAKGREAILNIHAKGKPFDSAVDMGVLAKRTPGFTGADLANALNESALLAARRNKQRITMAELEEALDRVMMGPARKSRVMNSDERKVTAYHEAGHAIIGELLEHCDPIHKVTVLPRGMALGVTMQLPDEDRYTTSRSELIDDITMLLGGLVAEEVAFGERYTGAGNDLERVTRIARAMIMQFGMSEKLGSLAIGRRSRNPFLGREMAEDRDYSEDVARQIDEEVHRLVAECHSRATQILTSHKQTMDRLAEALLERETLDREEFLAVMEGKELPPLPVPPSAPPLPNADTPKDKARPTQPTQLEPGTA